MLKTYRELEVWQKSMDLVVAAYELSRSLPVEEKFGLGSQIQRAAVSIPANIAEGYGRVHRREYQHHLSIANGSLAELETHLIIAVRLELVRRENTVGVWNLTQDVGKMLRKLSESLARKPAEETRLGPRSGRKTKTSLPDPRPAKKGLQ